MKKQIFFLLSFLILISACTTDFDVTGEWKEIAVVYGVLDKNDATHYIRVNKAFLGDENAYRMAEENDSINFSNLTVRLFEFTESGTLVDSFDLDTTSVTLQNGIFGNPGNPIQRLWKTNRTLNQNYIYKLKVINNFSGKIVTSETPIVKNFGITQPSASPSSKIAFVGNNDAYSQYSVKFVPAINGKMYETTVVFYYRDVNLSTLDTVAKTVRWKQGAYIADMNENLIQINLEGENFYNYIKASVPVPPANVKRLIGKGDFDAEGDGNADDHIDIEINVGGTELYNYIEINKPAASGVLLDKPTYSNVENGLGVFSTRGKHSVINKGLSVKSINELKNGQYTASLVFRQESD